MESTQCLTELAQLHTEGGNISNLVSGKHWWKLEDRNNNLQRGYKKKSAGSLLFSRNFAFAKNTNDPRLAYLCTCAQRGLVSYNRPTVPELRNFCNQRGIELFRGRKKGEVMEMLEKADEGAVSTKFLDLPPELRVLVYEYSLDVLLEPGRKAGQGEAFRLPPPPVFSVCKLLRKESLPLFYTSATLQLQFRKYRAQHSFSS